MHASCQEMFKHSIPPQRVIDAFHPSFPHHSQVDAGESSEDKMTIAPSNARINITFRFYRPDYQPSSIPRCRCDVPCILRPDMKNRYESSQDMDCERNERKDSVAKYWWTCYAGAQNDGKGCNFWKVMDVNAEGRGPFLGGPDVESVPSESYSEAV